MATQDRTRWDERYTSLAPASPADVGPPAVFAAHSGLFPTHGQALELACGRGLTAVWLAQRGMTVLGVDVSAVAVGHAHDLATACGVGERCRFEAVDLDDGLPAGPPANVIVCHRFRDARLDRAIAQRLAPGGLLAISALSEVGATPGTFRVRAGELPQAFSELELLAADEADGLAWLLACR